MCEKSGIFNSNSVPTHRIRTITKKAYRTNVPYPHHYKKSVPYQRTVLPSKNQGVPYRTTVPYRTVPYCHPCFQHKKAHDSVYTGGRCKNVANEQNLRYFCNIAHIENIFKFWDHYSFDVVLHKKLSRG